MTVLGDAAEDAVEAVEMGVLMMTLKLRYRINQIIGDARNNLSKTRTTIAGRTGAIPRCRLDLHLRAGVDEQAGNAQFLRQRLEFAGRNFADHLAGIGVDFLNHLMPRR